MTELELYKFITENSIEWRYIDEDEVIVFISFHFLDEWSDCIWYFSTEDEWLDCVMKDTYMCFYMKDLCEMHDIELEKIFSNPN